MTFKEFYTIIDKNNYYVFSFEDILSFFPNEERNTLKKSIYRWKEKGWLCSLKRGLYEITYPKDFIIPDMHIANHLYSPSYVSLETALSNYSIIPQVSMAVTSITTKPTRRFKNKHGLFIFRTVKPEIFTGYCVEKQGNFDILVAEPEKALVDFLYFKTYRSKRIDIDEERLDRRVISRLNKKKIDRYAKLYNMNIKEFHVYL
jgi:predicted transcriptional regulator of viral defense system